MSKIPFLPAPPIRGQCPAWHRWFRRIPYLPVLLFALAATAAEQPPPATTPAPSPRATKPSVSAPAAVKPAPSPTAPAPAPSSPLQSAPAPVTPSPDAGLPAQPATPPPPVVTAEDFLRLWDESKLEEKLQRQRPPLEGVIRSASYRAEIAGQPDSPSGLLIQADLQVQSLHKGWSVVPISAQPLPVIKAETGNAFLTLRDQGYLVLLPEEGTYSVQLSLAFPVEAVDGTPTAAINLPQSPVSSFSGTLPGLGWSVKTSRNLFPIRTSAEGNNTQFAFSPGATTSFQLQWEKPEDDKAKTAVIFAETEIQTHLRPDAVRSEARISLQLPRAAVDRLKVSLSPDHELLSVAGEAIKTWKLQKEAKTQGLEVWFSAPQRDRAELRLVLEQSIPQLPSSASLPVIRVEGALRQGGSIEVVEERDVTATLDAIQNLTRQASEFRAAPQLRHLGRYRFLRGDYGANLKIAETTPRISASADTLFRLDEAFSSFVTNLRLDIQGRAVLQSFIVLPAGFQLEKAEGESLREFEVKGSRLAISYLTPQLGTVQLELTGKKPRREGAVEEQALPHFTVENALEFQGRVRLEFPPSIQVDLRNDASPMALRPAPGSFEYLNTPSPSSLVVTRKAPHVEVVTSTEIHFKHLETTIRCSLDYQIRNRFPERLLLRIPASLAGQVEFTSPTLAVIDRKVTPAPASANRSEDESLFSYWALHDPNETLGQHHVELRVTEKLPDPAYNQPLITPSLILVPLQADRLDGTVAISQDENVVLKPVTETGLRTLPAAGPATPGRGPSFEFSSSDADLTFAVTRLRYVELPSLAVDLADVTHVVSGDGSISSEIACRVIADQPADLEIQLPPGAWMNSQVFCNETPISPRQTTEESVVAVTIDPKLQQGESGETLIRFTYDVPSALASKSLGDRGDFPIPVASLRNAKTLDSRTTLYLPPAYRYYGLDTPMTLQSNVLGWTRAKRYLSRLVPSLKTWIGDESEIPDPAASVQSIPAFEYRIPLRKEGQKFTFLHSAAPDAIAVSYLSQRYATLLEAGAFLLALFLGILISRKPLEAKIVFLVFAGALALVAASFAAPHLAAIYQAVCLGALSSVVFWFLAGLVSLFQGIRLRAPAMPVPGSIAAFPQPLAPESEDISPFAEERQPEAARAKPEVSTAVPQREDEEPGKSEETPAASEEKNGLQVPSASAGPSPAEPSSGAKP